MAKRKQTRSRCYIDAAGRRRCPRLGAAKRRTKSVTLWVALPPRSQRPCFCSTINGELYCGANTQSTRAALRAKGARAGYVSMWGCKEAKDVRTDFSSRAEIPFGWEVGLDPSGGNEFLDGVRKKGR